MASAAPVPVLQLPTTPEDRVRFRQMYIYNEAFRMRVVRMCARFPWLLQDSAMVPNNLAWFAAIPVAEYMRELQQNTGVMRQIGNVEEAEVAVLRDVRDRMPAAAQANQDVQALVRDRLPGVNTQTLLTMLPSILAAVIAGSAVKSARAPRLTSAYYSGNVLPDSLKAYEQWGRFETLSNRWYFSGLPDETLRFIRAEEARRH